MHKLEASTPPRRDSSIESDSSPSQVPQSRALYASERALLLFGQYRRGQANDPDVYVASVAAILADYPMETIRYVTDPRTGIAANPPRADWTGMPDTADVKSACDQHHRPARYAAEFEAAAREQIAQRDDLAIADQRPRKTYEQIAAEFAEVGIILGPKGSNTKPVDLGAFREKFGITQEQWDAIPSHPEDRARRDKQGLP